MPTQTADIFQARLDTMIDMRHPLAVLANRLPWAQLETALAPVWQRKSREGTLTEQNDLFGVGGTRVGAGVSAAGPAANSAHVFAAVPETRLQPER